MEVTFPQGVERIDAFAFSECANLEQIMLTTGLSLVDKSAFADCPKLKDVYFSGTQAQWNSACKWPAGQPYASIRIHCGTVPGLPATDVEQGRWSAGDITYAYQNGLMKGTGPGMFEPTTRTTRGMIVTILHRIEQQPSASQAVSFWDVAAGSYYYEAVRWAASEGIVNGTGDGAFQPDSGITREQLAVILYRYAVYNGQAGSGDASAINRYGDAYAVSDYAREALGWAITTGLINGNGGLLEPKTVATREQVAAILHRFGKLQEDNRKRGTMSATSRLLLTGENHERKAENTDPAFDDAAAFPVASGGVRRSHGSGRPAVRTGGGNGTGLR
jgi:hypothetical protein